MQNTKNYYLGIDVSKGYADFVILDAQKQPVEENFQLDDTFEGHALLYEKLSQFFKDHPQSIIYAAVESTGGYENNWFNSLRKFQATLNIRIARLNPLGVSANSKAGLKRNLTDKISAQNIAEYLIAHPEKVSYQQQDPFLSLRKQWNFVKMLTKQSTQLLNQLQFLLYTAFPEILVYCKWGIPEWVLNLLKRYPTAPNLAKAKAKTIAQIPYISRERAKELIASAQKSVASATDTVTQELIVSMVKQILQLKKVIQLQTKVMEKACCFPEVELLKTFPGISNYSALGLMLEIQTLERFPSVKKLASFFGLHPVYKISGDGVGAFRMSKQGRKEPRCILFMVTITAIAHNPYLRSIYNRYLQRGMEKMVAIGICMHKILRIIYGMLKHNQPFDPEIDRKNVEKSFTVKPRVQRDKSRRLQDYDPRAPISRRQTKKREERRKSQGDQVAVSGIIAPVPL